MNESKESILDCIGDTPLIKVNKIFKNLNSKFYSKCEYMNPTGSMEDRIAKNNLNNYSLNRNTEVEVNSSKLAVSYSLVASNLDIPLTLKTNEYIPFEKTLYLEALGTKIKAPNYRNQKILNKINYTASSNQNSIELASTYSNNKHKLKDIANEINEKFNGKIDYIFINNYLGGAIAGIGELMKILRPGIKIIGVKYFLNEIPCVLDRGIADEWVNVSNIESNDMLKMAIKNEGLLIGNISAMTLCGAYKFIEKLEKTTNHSFTSIIILPDSIHFSIGSLLS